MCLFSHNKITKSSNVFQTNHIVTSTFRSVCLNLLHKPMMCCSVNQGHLVEIFRIQYFMFSFVNYDKFVEIFRTNHLMCCFVIKVTLSESFVPTIWCVYLSEDGILTFMEFMFVHIWNFLSFGNCFHYSYVC